MPMPVDLGYAMKLEPKLAVDYFRSKGYEITWNWQEALQSTHARAFTVAKAARLDVLETIRGEVDWALSEGITEREFINALTPRLQAAGWYGKQVVVDSAGGAEVVQLGSPQRLSTIYRTNLATSYQAGRYQQQLASTETHPYWQYIAIVDGNTRPAHKALHGRVFHYTDPIWQTMYPPNDWGCRCRVRALTAAQVKQMGLKVESSVGKLETGLEEAGFDKRTGEIYEQPVTTFTDGKERMRTGAGWSGNVGAAAMGSDVNVAKKLVSLQNRELRKQVIQSLNNAPARRADFAQWVGNVLTTRRPGNGVQPLGFISDDIAAAVEARTGEPSARLLAVSEKNIIHADSLKHRQKGISLSLPEYQALPDALAKPDAVLWDTQNKNLLYVSGNGDSASKIVVNSPYGVRKQPDALDVVINAYKVPLHELRNAITGGNYELLQGAL